MRKMLVKPNKNVKHIKHSISDNVKMALHNRINELFADKPNVKNTELAKFCKVSRATVTDWRNGNTKSINGDNAFSVARFFCVNPEWVQNGKGEKYNRATMPKKSLESIFSGSNLTLSTRIQIVEMPFITWSEYCLNPNSINKTKELEIMMIDNGINVSEEIYAIDLDSNTFKGLPVGTRILIDPKRMPEKNNTVVLSIDDGIPTLVRWNPGLGLLQVEPLESGYPGSISLEGKNYTVLGVAVWQNAKGGALI